MRQPKDGAGESGSAGRAWPASGVLRSGGRRCRGLDAKLHKGCRGALAGSLLAFPASSASAFLFFPSSLKAPCPFYETSQSHHFAPSGRSKSVSLLSLLPKGFEALVGP